MTDVRRLPFFSTSTNRHEWYQNDSYVTISVFIKNAKKESVDINITEKAVSPWRYVLFQSWT